MRVLLSAYACRPGHGSEPGTGWAFAQLVAERHDVWVLTTAHNREAIEPARQGDNPRFVYVEPGRSARALGRMPYGVQLGYLAWQPAAGRAARALHAEVGFDLVHHVTYSADWMPAGVLRLADVPSVWGPVGGTTGMAAGLWRWLGWRGVAQEVLREGLTGALRRVHGRAAARRASVVVAQNHDVADRFRTWSHRTVVMPHVVTEPVHGGRAGLGGAPGRRLALFVGRLLPWKGLVLAVAALAEPEARDWRLEVFGDGPERARAERLARRLGVRHRVLFRGPQPHDAVLAAMSTADAMLAPSMHEAGGWAVAEAVARGCPVVCLDRGGPAVVVDDAHGVRLPVTRDLPARMARALADVGGRAEPCERWSAERVRERVEEIYALAVGATRVRG